MTPPFKALVLLEEHCEHTAKPIAASLMRLFVAENDAFTLVTFFLNKALLEIGGTRSGVCGIRLTTSSPLFAMAEHTGTLFRGNTFGTYLSVQYMLHYGDGYLKSIVASYLSGIVASVAPGSAVTDDVVVAKCCELLGVLQSTATSCPA